MAACKEHLAYRCSKQLKGHDVIKGAFVSWSSWLEGAGKFQWDGGSPRNCLISKKPHSAEASKYTQAIGSWLKERGLTVYVEVGNHDEFPDFLPLERIEDVELCITLGGDGTVLHVATIFGNKAALPPFICFALGTLGFLTPLDVRAYSQVLEAVLGTNGRDSIVFTARVRNECTLVDQHGDTQAVYTVLNECVMSRGAYPSMLHISLCVDDHHVSTVTGDGLVVATSTGSTAYSLSAGGPIMLPNVPASIIIPVAAFSLTLRPLIVAATSEVVLGLEACAPHPCQISFDGQHTVEMQPGWHVRIHRARYPLPALSLGCAACDWYAGLVMKLGWGSKIKKVAVHKTPSERYMLDIFPDENPEDAGLHRALSSRI